MIMENKAAYIVKLCGILPNIVIKIFIVNISLYTHDLSSKLFESECPVVFCAGI